MKIETTDKFMEKVGVVNYNELKSIINSSVVLSNEEKETLISSIENEEYAYIYAHGESYLLLAKLIENSNFHIATECLFDLDNGNISTSISNNFAYVNRERFYICNGDSNPELYTEEEIELG